MPQILTISVSALKCSLVAMKRILKEAFTLLILFSFSLLLNTSCSQTIKSLSEVSAFRNELIKEYKEQDINVVIQNSRTLDISFINSSFNNLGEQERANKAREIARFAKNHFASIDSVDKVWVSFVIAKNYIIFNYTNSVGAYLFDKNELIAVTTSNKLGEQGVALASYNSLTNETSVYLKENLQVYADPRSGIMLFPHLTIPGDNATTPKIVKPESVILDFTTYSEKRMFPVDPNVVIYVDDKKIFSGKAQLTNVMGSEAEKSFNEFLSRKIPYSQFVQLTEGKKVKMILGAKEFEFTAEHLKALRNLRRCVEELRCTKVSS